MATQEKFGYHKKWDNDENNWILIFLSVGVACFSQFFLFGCCEATFSFFHDCTDPAVSFAKKLDVLSFCLLVCSLVKLELILKSAFNETSLIYAIKENF